MISIKLSKILLKKIIQHFNYNTLFMDPFTPGQRTEPRVGPEQLCALAHLGCIRAVGTS